MVTLSKPMTLSAKKCGIEPAKLTLVAGAIDWQTLFSVFLQLLPVLSNSIPAVFDIIDQLVTAIKSGTFTWAAFAGLIQQDEPAVMAVIQEIAAALGIVLPPPVTPVVP